MSRMHPGKPPSQRRNPGWSDDWKERLRTTTRSLATNLKEMFGYDDPTVRKIIVHAVRIAIGGESQPSIQAIADAETGDGAGSILATTAATYREILDRGEFDRNDPLTAETFMEEVVRALDDEMGLGWRTKVRKLAGILAYNLRDKHDAAEIRQKLEDAVREAFSEKPSDEMKKVMTFPAQHGKPAVTDKGLSTAGCFRLVLDNENINRRDPTTLKDFMAEVAAGIDTALSKPSN